MSNRKITLLVVALVVIALLAISGTLGAQALTNNGFQRNSGVRMMNRQQTYGTMMNGQYNQGRMMGAHQQTPVQQGAPFTGVTHMNMQHFAYQMTNIQVRVGTTVNWTNRDSAPHSVTFRNGMMDSGLLHQGQSFSYTFNKPGTYQYYCSVHPYMVATVTTVP